MMDYTKISFTPAKDKKPPKVLLRWNDGEDEHEVVSPEPPSPAFCRALGALRPAAMSLCMIDDADPDDVEVRSVTLREDGEGERGLTITSLRSLDWITTPLVLNTPFASLSLIPETDLPLLLLQLFEQADEYVAGRRHQTSLFDKLSGGSEGIDSVTISVPGEDPVTLTREDKTAGRVR